MGIRRYLNQERLFSDPRVPPLPPADPILLAGPEYNGAVIVDPVPPHTLDIDGAFEEAEPDAVDDEGILEDGTEMVIDTQPLLDPHPSNTPLGASTTSIIIPLPLVPPLLSPNATTDARPIPLPSPGVEMEAFNYVGSYRPYVLQHFAPLRGVSVQDTIMDGSSPVDDAAGVLEDGEPAGIPSGSYPGGAEGYPAPPRSPDHMEGLPRGPQSAGAAAIYQGDTVQSVGPTLPQNST